MKKQRIKKIKENFNWFEIILLGSFIGATIICIIFSIHPKVIFLMNENQLLYLFSAMAQVIGGIFGLTLTAYVFFVNEFKELTKDDILGDAATTLVDRDFKSLILLAINCALTIFFCIIGMIDLHNWMPIYSFIINESVFLFLSSVVAIFAFGIILLEPNRLDKEVQRMKKNAEKYYQTASNSKTGDFKKFLKSYNLLEKLIIDFAKKYTEGQKREKNNRNNYKSQMVQSLRILYLCEIIDHSLLNEINELRMYRNGLVHGVDFNVTEDVCKRISKIYETLQESFNILQKNETGRDTEEWKRAIKKIQELSFD